MAKKDQACRGGIIHKKTVSRGDTDFLSVNSFSVDVNVLKTEFEFGDEKEDARRYFLQLRQLFIDMNYLKLDSDEFKQQLKSIEEKIAERSKQNA